MTDTITTAMTVDANEGLDDVAEQVRLVLGDDITKHYEHIESTPKRNLKHAIRALAGVQAYAIVTNCSTEPVEQVVRDLLSDLMHLTDLFLDDDERIDFDGLVSRAYGNYSDEVAGEA
jgi:hypothetical protein